MMLSISQARILFLAIFRQAKELEFPCFMGIARFSMIVKKIYAKLTS